jgi:hypothetical protein
MKRRVSTTEDLIMLPVETVLRGPDWNGEVYVKVGYVEFVSAGSETPWLASNLEPRGPFIILWPLPETHLSEEAPSD